MFNIINIFLITSRVFLKKFAKYPYVAPRDQDLQQPEGYCARLTCRPSMKTGKLGEIGGLGNAAGG
jgi:hypothetical protein